MYSSQVGSLGSTIGLVGPYLLRRTLNGKEEQSLGCRGHDKVHAVLPRQSRVHAESDLSGCVDSGDFVGAEEDTRERPVPSEETDVRDLTLARVQQEF